MESHEVLKEALRKTSPKAVAAELGVSLSLVYKWAEKPTADGSGSRNPLDRILEIIRLTGDNDILHWLCRQQGGSFVPDPHVGERGDDHVFEVTQEIIGFFSELLKGISLAIEDRSVTPEEANEIRLRWDQLKSFGESFVRACEAGRYYRIERSGAD